MRRGEEYIFKSLRGRRLRPSEIVSLSPNALIKVYATKGRGKSKRVERIGIYPRSECVLKFW